MLLFFCVIIITFIILIIKKGINNYSGTKKTNIDFDEFDDLEKIKEIEMKEKETTKYESQILQQVYYDATKKYNDSPIADEKIRGEVEKAKKSLNDFRIIDNVEVEKEDVKEGASIKSLREGGHTFDVELFKKWSRQIFGCIKIGNDEQLAVVKNFITDELFDRFLFQKKQFENDGLEFVTEDLVIENCKLLDYSKGLYQEDIKVLIESKMKEYIQDIKTNKIVRGDNKRYSKKSYVLNFTRKKSDLPEGLIHNCPNCGAEVSQTELGKCRYCNTLLFPIRYNWTLTKFETL